MPPPHTKRPTTLLTSRRPGPALPFPTHSTLSMPFTQQSARTERPRVHLSVPWEFTMVNSLLCLPLEEL
jgi:hypothetical protein